MVNIALQIWFNPQHVGNTTLLILDLKGEDRHRSASGTDFKLGDSTYYLLPDL